MDRTEQIKQNEASEIATIKLGNYEQKLLIEGKDASNAILHCDIE